MKSPKIRAVTGRSRLGLALVLGAVMVALMALAVSAHAEILPSETSTSLAESTGPIKTHSNAGYDGAAAPFSIPCDGCHVPHKADSMKLLQADGAAICARCHDLNAIHSDPDTQQSVSASSAPGDCLTCHPHSSGFMPVSGAVSLTLSERALGYDDLDLDGNLSPGDRVHYRIDYGNPGPEEVTGVLLRDELDTAHVAKVEAIAADGTFDGTAVRWNIGTLAAGASGSVTYDVVLEDALAFGGSATTPTTTAPPTTESLETTESLTTTTTATTESHTTTITLMATDHSGHDREPVDGHSGDGGESDEGHNGDDREPVDGHNGDGGESDEGHNGDGGESDDDNAGPATGSAEVINIAVLSADNREPVSTSAAVSVVVAGSASTTSTVSPTSKSTTTTAPPMTPAPTIVAGPTDVVNIAVLIADNREPVATSVILSVVVAGLSSTESPTFWRTKSLMTDPDPSALTLSERALGYDDLDLDGNLSPGDRVHYRIDYGNPGPEEVAGVLLRDELDTAHIANVEAIAADGTFDGTAVRWNIGTLAAGASGSVTYDVVLEDALAFGGSVTTSTTTAPPTTESLETTESLTTTTTATTESPTATTSPDLPTTESPTTTLSPAPGPETTGVPVAALAVFPLAGAAIRRFVPRKKARRRGTKPPERH